MQEIIFFKGRKLYFKHRLSFDAKTQCQPSAEGKSYSMVIVEAFAHYVVLSRVPHYDDYFVYTPHYEHWVAKFGLPK